MAIHAAAVAILIEKGKFEPQIALGIAEAMDVTIVHAQLVTVPVLDARLHELRAEIRALEAKLETKLAALEVKMEGIKSELVRWVFLTMLGNVALSAGVSALLKYLG